ncbi:MAG: rhomboid family intramembrane serine protease [Chitinophagaceae bacterium]
MNKRPLFGADSNALTWLIIINAVVFVLLNFIKIIYYLTDTPIAFFDTQILNWWVLSNNPDTFITRPYTLLTYMFTQVSVFGVIANMLWLWMFGYILQDLTGNRKLIPIYLYGGVIGGIVFVATTNMFAGFAMGTPYIMGAGAAVMAVAVATTTLAPDYRLFQMINGGIPLWIITLIYVAIDFAFVASANGGYALAHLSGALIGFIFIKQVQRGNDWGEWMVRFWYWLDDLFNPEKKHSKPSKEKHYYKATGAPYKKTPNITQQRVDALLDKINQKGYHFLTDEEKEFLKKASEQNLL